MATRAVKTDTSGGKSKATGTRKKAPAAKKPERAPAKPVPAKADTPAPAVVTETKAVVAPSELKKKELLDVVVERSGVRKKFAKPVVEAMIDVLGEALAEGREINLQPFGKLKQQRTKDTSNAQIIVAKICQSKAAGPALDLEDRADMDEGEISSKESVADAAE